ncbi:MAG TPA: sigma-70 family RNA polymerase sigma factor [Thermoanaerobaculia bacterium]|nr:sigma-70 family RNA polymerase sigma factor [Thermoanaerobaculia bacterium]
MATPETLLEPGEEEIAAGLVRRIGEGDTRAEGELVERYSRGLLYMLRRRAGDPALADDLHQETFRIVLERLRRQGIEDPARLSGFILQTARNLFLGDYRKKTRRGEGHDVEESPEPADPAPGQLTGVLRREEAARVRQVLAEMGTDRDRQILFRFYIAEEDKEAICADLGLSSLHFNRVLFRARERFKSLMTRAGPAPERPG